MRRLASFAATLAICAACAHAADAAEARAYLSWPGKAASQAPAPAKAAPAAAEDPGALTLSKTFFGATDDMAAPPPPLMPRNVPGTPAVTNPSTINTASNRARQTELLTADSAADGPVGGAEHPN
jgi:hypothetical protein